MDGQRSYTTAHRYTTFSPYYHSASSKNERDKDSADLFLSFFPFFFTFFFILFIRDLRVKMTETNTND